MAMQLLYQIDVRGIEDAETIREGMNDEADSAEQLDAAFALATEAWAQHVPADETITALAPQWPTNRQPPVDRAILRLAHYEITSGRTPVKVSINEAVELAKRYGGENSFAFINGVLDKMAKKLAKTGKQESRKAENVQ